MWVTALFASTACLYFAAGATFLAFLGRGHEAWARAAVRILWLGGLSHLAFLVADFAALGSMPWTNIHKVVAVASWLLVMAYLIVAAPHARLRVLGAFVAPLSLLFFLGAGFGQGVADVGEGVRSALLPVHVVVNLLGLSAFGLAFVVALAYLIQERQLRQKHLGGIFQRLPPLDVLESLSFRLVVVGFPLFTLGVISGTVWAVQLDPGAPPIGATRTIAVISWLLFALVLLLRVAAGWRGRRAAIGTMLGFACACAVLVGYMLRDGRL